VAKIAARRIAHSSPVAAAVDSSVQVNVGPILNSTAPNSPPRSHMQTRQAAAVKKAASAAAVSNSKSSASQLPVSSLSKALCHSPMQHDSGTTNTSSAASKISSALRDCGRRTRSGTSLRTNTVDKDGTIVTYDRESVNKSISSTTAGAIAHRGIVKPCTTEAIKRVRTLQSRTVHAMDSSHAAKTTRDKPTPSTRSTKTQTSSVVVTRSTDSGHGSDQAAVTKHPPPPPSKLKTPGFVPGMTRGRIAEQKRRPASTDCSTVNSVRQQPVDVCRTKSDSCTNVANLSTSTGQTVTTRKSAKGVLNRSSQLAKSCDCITPLSNNSESENSDVICSATHGSSTSLVDTPPRKLVKPYSVINRCSTFGRRMKEVHSTTTDSSAKMETENAATTVSRSSLASQARASELSCLPEADEFECDCHMSANDRLSTDESRKDSDGRRQRTAVERTATAESPSICPNIQQNLTEGYKYRVEYSTFLTVVPPKNDNKLSFETVQVASTNDSSSHRDCVSMPTKQDKNDIENNCSSTTKHPGNDRRIRVSRHEVDDFRLSGYNEPASKTHISEARPDVLSAGVAIMKDATATAEEADRPSSADNYVVTYESDDIIVLDREPVVDCLTPDADIVSTEVCKLLTVAADVGTASGDGALSRTLPLSESGYDTWKSSQASVAVAIACTGNTCMVAPDCRAIQREKRDKDGILLSCACDRLKTFDTQSAQPTPEKNIYVAGRETCTEGNDSFALFSGESNLQGESTDTAAGAAVEVKDDDGDGESSRRDDDSGRVAENSVEDSALRDAQMFASICSDAAEPVAGATSCSGKWRIANSASSQDSGSSLSPPDNAAFGFVDPTDICFASRTIPSNDSDLLSPFSASPHLERFDEEMDHASSSLLPEMDHFCHQVHVEISGASDNSADVVHDDTRLCFAVISTRRITKDCDTGGDFVADVKQLGEHQGVFCKVCLSHLQLSDFLNVFVIYTEDIIIIVSAYLQNCSNL